MGELSGADLMSITVITGPTASGKTAHALAMARENPLIEIVNADASLLYRGFDIGTSKPTKEEREGIPHHQIDILAPSERYSAAEYSKTTRLIIRDILQRKKIPVVVGGTGLYIDALFGGLVEFAVSDEVLREVRRRVRAEIAAEGFDTRHEALRKIDPPLFEQINRERNPIRLERAWIHYYATGIPLGVARQHPTDKFEHQPEYQVLSIERVELKLRVAARIDRMIDAGWLEEVSRLRANGVVPTMPAMKAIGYREMWDVLQGTLALNDAKEAIQIRTMQYAKRQRTWMRKYLEQSASPVSF